jgi:uncharacterized protein
VTNPRYPLRINVGFIVSQPISYSRDFHFEYANIHLQPDLDLEAFKGAVKVSRTPQGLIAQGYFQAVAPAQCVRCLVNFQQPLRTEFSELFAFSSRTMSDSELILPEDGNMDLDSLVREYILIETPISPLCRPDCQGLCTICGENLNNNSCEHQTMGSAHIIIPDKD